MLSDMEALAPQVIAFSDDGRGVQSPEMMEEAMKRAKDLGKLIVAHCEDNALLHGGYIHDGAYAKAHGHRGICSESEWGPIARDLELAAKTGCGYHVCHISTRQSVDRFAGYLHNLKKTQFIVITHRRGTMEAADVLYGVTMQEQGVSKLLRLDLNQMEEYLGIGE